ncbi:MAG: hypothetical protein HETSPECPRED_000858 [Heterodermia speciosa]|uniref:Uncharacterized protein n=1 Tax=Heterodermia speciosa TaxID=116794 RepID=A0A8H3EXP7_9LECA|nr:MAG: hypothetical protein HETSPECPRED_000858 [Heterodermia speciosa]
MAPLLALLGAMNQAAATKHFLFRSIIIPTDGPENTNGATQAMLRSLDNTILCIVVGIESELERYCTHASEFDLVAGVYRFAHVRDMLAKCPKPGFLDMRIDQAMLKMVRLMERKWKAQAAEAAKTAHGLP